MNNLNHIERWTDLSIKDKLQYICAVILIISGIVAAFVCIICNTFNISTGVLIYIAQAFVTAGGIFGVSVYFKSKLGEFDTRQKATISDEIDRLIDHFDNQMSSDKQEIETKIDKK